MIGRVSQEMAGKWGEGLGCGFLQLGFRELVYQSRSHPGPCGSWETLTVRWGSGPWGGNYEQLLSSSFASSVALALGERERDRLREDPTLKQSGANSLAYLTQGLPWLS